jgi:hypothetical protein
MDALSIASLGRIAAREIRNIPGSRLNLIQEEDKLKFLSTEKNIKCISEENLLKMKKDENLAKLTVSDIKINLKVEG